jgi:hypothetical protein
VFGSCSNLFACVRNDACRFALTPAPACALSLQPTILLSGFSNSGKSNLTMTLALMAICRGDAVVYIPNCETWQQGGEIKQAEFWVECAKVSLYGHLDRACKVADNNLTWGDLLFQQDPVKAHADVMKELLTFQDGDKAVLLIYDEQGKVATRSDSPILCDAQPEAVVRTVVVVVRPVGVFEDLLAPFPLSFPLHRSWQRGAASWPRRARASLGSMRTASTLTT